MINRFILDRLRNEEQAQHTPQNVMDIVQTKFEDNHGVVISGGNNNVHIHMRDGKIDSIDTEPATEAVVIPAALSSEKAQALLKKAQQAGLLDADFQPVGNKRRAAVIADEMADILGLEPRWKPFEELWGLTNLRQSAYDAAGTSKGGSTRDEVRKALK